MNAGERAFDRGMYFTIHPAYAQQTSTRVRGTHARSYEIRDFHSRLDLCKGSREITRLLSRSETSLAHVQPFRELQQ
jgi:hypothetical protein